MSRSNPSEHLSNPSTRWFEWNAAKGCVRYYDKDKKENVDVPLPFSFILLDRLGCIGGWHDESGSGIYSNEVKDTRADTMIVRAFKGGTIAEGLYKDIRLQVKSEGGSFVVSCYIAFKDGDQVAIGSIKFKGAARGAWMDFEKANRDKLYEGSIAIHNWTEGKKGGVTFRIPTMKLCSVTAETNAQAIELDKTVQRFLQAYLKRNKREQVDVVAKQPAHVTDEDIAFGVGAEVTSDDIPF